MMKNLNAFTSTISLLFLVLVVTACQSDDSEAYPASLTQSWQLVSKTKNGNPVTLSDCEKEELVSFSSESNTNVCYFYFPCENKDMRTAWNYEDNNQVLNISDLLPVTYYIQQVETATLSLKYYLYSPAGQLDTYTKQYKAVKTSLVNGKLRLANS